MANRLKTYPLGEERLGAEFCSGCVTVKFSLAIRVNISKLFHI